LNPGLHRTEPQTQRTALDSIARTIEAKHPQLAVGYFLFADNPASSIHVIMNTRQAAADGRLDRDSPRPTEIFADPYTGQLMGERNWGEFGSTAAHVMPLIYRLHISRSSTRSGTLSDSRLLAPCSGHNCRTVQ